MFLSDKKRKDRISPTNVFAVVDEFVDRVHEGSDVADYFYFHHDDEEPEELPAKCNAVRQRPQRMARNLRDYERWVDEDMQQRWQEKLQREKELYRRSSLIGTRVQEKEADGDEGATSKLSVMNPVSVKNLKCYLDTSAAHWVNSRKNNMQQQFFIPNSKPLPKRPRSAISHRGPFHSVATNQASDSPLRGQMDKFQMRQAVMKKLFGHEDTWADRFAFNQRGHSDVKIGPKKLAAHWTQKRDGKSQGLASTGHLGPAPLHSRMKRGLGAVREEHKSPSRYDPAMHHYTSSPIPSLEKKDAPTLKSKSKLEMIRTLKTEKQEKIQHGTDYVKNSILGNLFFDTRAAKDSTAAASSHGGDDIGVQGRPRSAVNFSRGSDRHVEEGPQAGGAFDWRRHSVQLLQRSHELDKRQAVWDRMWKIPSGMK